MKLTQYIVYESNASAAQKGKKIVDTIMGRLYKALERKSFIIDHFELEELLNRISPKNVNFKLAEHKKNLGRLIGYGNIQITTPDTAKPDVTINLHLTKNAAEYFRRFAREDKKSWFFDKKKNQFYREVYELLTHEIAHELQAMKSSLKIDWNWEKMDSSYISNKGEIDAFALQAALQIINSDRSQIWDIYMTFKSKGLITDKVYNRFMKKVYKNIKELQRLGLTK